MFTVDVKQQYNNNTTTQSLLQINDLHWVLGCNYLGAINLTLGWFSNKRKFYHAVKQSLFYSMVKFPFIGECYNIRRPTSRWRLWYISWYIHGLCSQLSKSWHLGKGGRVCSNNPDHKMGMLAQRILKMPSSISLGVLELPSPNILTY